MQTKSFNTNIQNVVCTEGSPVNRETSYFYKDWLQQLVIWENGSKLGPLQLGGPRVFVREWYVCFYNQLAKWNFGAIQKFVQVSPTLWVKPPR